MAGLALLLEQGVARLDVRGARRHRIDGRLGRGRHAVMQEPGGHRDFRLRRVLASHGQAGQRGEHHRHGHDGDSNDPQDEALEHLPTSARSPSARRLGPAAVGPQIDDRQSGPPGAAR